MLPVELGEVALAGFAVLPEGLAGVLPEGPVTTPEGPVVAGLVLVAPFVAPVGLVLTAPEVLPFAAPEGFVVVEPAPLPRDEPLPVPMDDELLPVEVPAEPSLQQY